MTSATRPRWDPDDLAQLEHERDILLRDLRELEAQHATGEIDSPQYEALRDELTTRAADTIALAERGKVNRPHRAPRPRSRLLAAAGIVTLAVAAGLLLADQLAPRVRPAPPVAQDADAAARIARLAATVEERPDDIPARLALARLLIQDQDFSAAQRQFDAVVDLDDNHAEALTYAGWLATLTGDTPGGLDRLDRAVAADPAYPDAHALRGLALMRTGDSSGALAELRRYLHLAPNGPLAAQVNTVIARLEGAP